MRRLVAKVGFPITVEAYDVSPSGKWMIETNVADRLAPLCAPILSLAGVGAKTEALIARVAEGRRIIDLLLTLPERYTLRPRITGPLEPATLTAGAVLTTNGRITHIEKATRHRQPHHVYMQNAQSEVDLVFFNPVFLKTLRVGQEICASGQIEWFRGRLTMPQPDYVVPAKHATSIPAIDPVWPLTAGLFQSNMRKALKAALSQIPELPEWLDPKVVTLSKWPTFKGALYALHAPDRLLKTEQLSRWPEIQQRARARLACDRLFYDQLAMGVTRLLLQSQNTSGMIATGHLQAETLRRFGHGLTQAQTRARTEISQNLTQGAPMRRLLQGDVGSGKTIVALLAMLHAVEAGYQTALMAPTELLAKQHYETISRLSPEAVTVTYLSGAIKGKRRRDTLSHIADGRAQVVIGTHALFQEQVVFHKLGLCIVDEQHRFGVAQRLKFGNKGRDVNMLVMTATPIPRSLLLTRWGELSVSQIDEKPPGRVPIKTSLHPISAQRPLVAGIERKIRAGAQVYWVCPLIEESEKLDLTAAEDRYHTLAKAFPGRVALAHGGQDVEERQRVLTAFREGRHAILVATTVIEVGVDIPRASVMVVEHAERFGLAQLHQLRGRVGRGATQSFCLLLYDETASTVALSRLNLLKQTEDGFLIAEEDYRMRGGGDIAGLRQTGMPNPRLFSGIETLAILKVAKTMAEAYWREHTAIPPARDGQFRQLSRLFNGDEAWDLLASG